MSSSAARRGGAQRVLILSRPRRLSRVCGGARHPALRVRQVSPSTAFAPKPRPPGAPRARPRCPRPIGSAGRGSQGGAGGRPEVAGGIPGRRTAREERCAPAVGCPRRLESRAPRRLAGQGEAPPRLQSS